VAKFILPIVIFIVLAGLVFSISRQFKAQDPQNNTVATPPPPEKIPLGEYTIPKIAADENYSISFVGDSMTAALGPNCDKLALFLNESYPGKVFGFNNYSIAASNVLSLDQRLTESTDITERVLPPILETDFDVIFIESFAHNPLSQYPLEEGLQKQNQQLEITVNKLIKAKPDSQIVFLATIGPSTTEYAKNVVDLSPEARLAWANERIAYLQNHIKFANDHKIPLVNVYEKSKDPAGEVDIKYVNPSDYIHPSKEGVELISREIFNFLIENQILPR